MIFMSCGLACAAGVFRQAWRYHRDVVEEARFLRAALRDILDQNHL